MHFIARNNEKISFREVGPGDYCSVSDYLQKLHPNTQVRFGPHPYDEKSIADFYTNNKDSVTGYIALQELTGTIISYSIIKNGILEHDRFRLESYGLRPDAFSDITYAPSVADNWQHCGIGYETLHLIKTLSKERGINRIILWGGVQADNRAAIRFYERNGFKELGRFVYNGYNLDMMALL